MFVDHHRCISIKNKTTKYKQCSYKKVQGDYCKLHAKAKNVINFNDYFYQDKRNKYLLNNNMNKIRLLQNKIRNNYMTKISGPAYNNLCLIDNDKDILSHELILVIKNNNKIPACEFDRFLLFSYKTKFNNIKGFNILSLKDMFNNDIYIDPFTNEQMDQTLINKINNKINFLEKINYKSLLTENKLTNEDIHRMKINEILKKFDILGLFIDIRWFDKLDNNQIRTLYNEMQSMWQAFKSDNPNDSIYIMDDSFAFKVTKSTLNNTNDKNKLQEYIILEFDKLISSGLNDIAKKMGGYIAIGALIYVLPEVKSIYNDIIFD